MLKPKASVSKGQPSAMHLGFCGLCVSMQLTFDIWSLQQRFCYGSEDSWLMCTNWEVSTSGLNPNHYASYYNNPFFSTQERASHLEQCLVSGFYVCIIQWIFRLSSHSLHTWKVTGCGRSTADHPSAYTPCGLALTEEQALWNNFPISQPSVGKELCHLYLRVFLRSPFSLSLPSPSFFHLHNIVSERIPGVFMNK